MKKIRSIIILLFFALLVLLTGKNDVKADYYEYNFSFSGTVSGVTGEYLSGQIYSINLGSTSLVRTLPQGTDISSWFSGATSPKPAGMRVVVYEEAEVGAKSIKVEFKGLVYGASKDIVTMTVQLYYFDSSILSYDYIADVNLSGGGKYNVVRNFTKPDGYMGVGYGIYFDKSQNKGNGFVLRGTKGEELTGSGRELNVVIDGCFLTSLPKNKDITSWFTGHVTAQNLAYNTSLNSQLPPGITVKLKNAVAIGDNSFTMVFSGTPTKGSRDLIAITIPAGYITYNAGVTSDYKGDLQDALKTYNASGHFVYDIESPDNDYKSVYILATYPDTTIHAGSTYTEEDGLKISYQLVGTDSAGTPYKYKDIQLGKTIKDYIVQNVYSGERYEPISKYTGLTPTITYISEDGTYMEATITGKAKKTESLLLSIGSGSGSQLLHSYSTYGQYIDIVGSEDTHLYFGQPDPQITVSKDIVIESAVFDESPSFSDTTFTISFGNDTLAKSFSKGDRLGIFAYKSSVSAETTLTKPEKEWGSIELWNNICVKAAENTPAGSDHINVYLESLGSIKCDYYGYVYLAFPRSYLTNATAYGSDGMYEQAGYPIENSRIFANVEKYANYYAKASTVRLEGVFHNARFLYDELVEDPGEESGYRVAGTWVKETFLSGIGKGKVNFTVETLHDINVTKDYAAGASVKDLIRLNEMTVETSPFQRRDVSYPVFYEYWYYDYDIHTAKAITKDNDGEKNAHTFELYFDLSEIRAKQSSDTKLVLEIFDGSGWKTVYTSNGSVFDIDGGWFETKDAAEYTEYKKTYANSSESSASEEDITYETGIVYDKQVVIVYAKDASGNKVQSTYIDLTGEKLITDVDYKCYSTDGGTKWKAATKKLTDKNIASMLNKGMTLVIADKFDSKTKAPADDAVIYTFDEINARPTAPKLKVNYSLYPDALGAGAGQWGLTDATGAELSAEDLALLDIGLGDSKGKAVNSDGYGSWPSSEGLNVVPLSGTKVATYTFFVRVSPTADTPASKVVKVKVKGQQKAPNVKANYKNETLKVKKDMIVYFGTSASVNAAELAENAKTYDDYAGKIYKVTTAEQAKAGVSIAAYITDTRNTILIWNAATAKKPASKAQELVLPARAAIEATALTVSGGKFKLDKKYEVYDADKGKWGGLPKITQGCELKIRLKATAKSGKESDTTFAASASATLKITWGEYDTSKHKEGITAAEITD